MPKKKNDRKVALVRRIESENATYIDLFRCTPGVADPEKAMRAAIAEFLTTSAGRRAFKETYDDFNWGDSLLYVPASIWKRNGLRLINSQERKVVRVDQDEVFYPPEENGDGG